MLWLASLVLAMGLLFSSYAQSKMEFLFLNIETSDRADTNFIRMFFSEPMENAGLFDKTKYKAIGNSGDTLEIYEVLYVPIDDYESVVIITNGFSGNSSEYIVSVINVSDKAGNLINQEKNFAAISIE